MGAGAGAGLALAFRRGHSRRAIPHAPTRNGSRPCCAQNAQSLESAAAEPFSACRIRARPVAGREALGNGHMGLSSAVASLTHLSRSLTTGVICGVRVENIEEPKMQDAYSNETGH